MYLQKLRLDELHAKSTPKLKHQGGNKKPNWQRKIANDKENWQGLRVKNFENFGEVLHRDTAPSTCDQ